MPNFALQVDQVNGEHSVGLISFQLQLQSISDCRIGCCIDAEGRVGVRVDSGGEAGRGQVEGTGVDIDCRKGRHRGIDDLSNAKLNQAGLNIRKGMLKLIGLNAEYFSWFCSQLADFCETGFTRGFPFDLVAHGGNILAVPLNGCCAVVHGGATGCVSSQQVAEGSFEVGNTESGAVVWGVEFITGLPQRQQDAHVVVFGKGLP